MKARFKTQSLTPIDGEPTFASVSRLEQELASNALTIKVSFGGGKKGTLGLVFSATKYFAEAGVDWVVPVSAGSFPIFTTGMTDEEKKATISEYLVEEYDIKVVEAMEGILKNQLLEAVPEDYILELKQGLSEYNDVALLDILKHLRVEYAPMTEVIYMRLLANFREPPNLDSPIDVYYAKQQECKLYLADSVDPISDNGMVIQLTTHMGNSGLINQAVTKFKRQTDPADKTWAKAKTWMRRALRDLKAESDLEGGDAVTFQAGGVFKNAAGPTESREEARDEIAGQMRESFGALAQAAVAKSETLDSNATTIASLTKAIAVLTETNRSLVAALATRTTVPPAARTNPGGATADPDMTGHHTNSDGNSCATKKWFAGGRWQFVSQQHCKNCTGIVNHIPSDCPELPGNEAIKLEMAERKAKRLALGGGGRGRARGRK